MSKNDDALRCAESLEGKRVYDDSVEWAETLDASAAHLRRLVAENEAQAALLRQAEDALNSVEWHGGGSCWIVDADKIYAAITAIRQHLEGK